MAQSQAIASMITLALASFVFAMLQGPTRADAAAQALASSEPDRAQLVVISLPDAAGAEGEARVEAALAEARADLFAEARAACRGREVVPGGATLQATRRGAQVTIEGHLPHRCAAPLLAAR
jgi:hypothetical protein